MHTCIHTYIHAYIHTYIHTNTHIHIHIYTCTHYIHPQYQSPTIYLFGTACWNRVSCGKLRFFFSLEGPPTGGIWTGGRGPTATTIPLAGEMRGRRGEGEMKRRYEERRLCVRSGRE